MLRFCWCLLLVLVVGFVVYLVQAMWLLLGVILFVDLVFGCVLLICLCWVALGCCALLVGCFERC